MIAQFLHRLIVHQLQLLLVLGVDLLLDLGPRVRIIGRVLLRRKILLSLVLRVVLRLMVARTLVVLGHRLILAESFLSAILILQWLLFELALQRGR